MVVLEKQNILLDGRADSCEAAVRLAAGILEKNGYINSAYVEEVLAREAEYPTGLPCEDFPIALPHAFSNNVLRTGVAVIRFAEPVPFKNLVDPEDVLGVEIVFLLANASGADGHLEELQELMNCFTRVGLLKDLKAAKDADEFIRVFENRESYPEG